MKFSCLDSLILKGHTVTLRPSNQSDYPYIKAIFNDRETMSALLDYFKVTEWTDSMIADRYDNYRLKQREGILIDFVVELIRTKQVVGNCGFNCLDRQGNSAEFGIILDRSVWGTSVAKECHLVCLRYAFEDLGLKSIKFLTTAGNVRMRRFFEKMQIPLTRRDDEFNCTYELQSDDWAMVEKKLRE